jgi:hypothetical protein
VEGLAATVADPLPIVFGTARVPGRVVYLRDKELGVKIITGVTGSSYREVTGSSAGAVVAICEAPASSSYLRVRRDKEPWRSAPSYMTDLLQVGVAEWEFVAAEASSSWARTSGTAVGMYWRGAAQFRAWKLGMPDDKVPDLQFEVRGRGVLGADTDAHPAEVVLDLLTTQRPGFRALSTSQVEVEVGLDGTAASSYRRYCDAMGWRVARAVTERTSVLELLESLLAATNASATWSEGKLKIVPLGDLTVVGAGGTYTPPAVVAALDDDELLVGDGPPVQVEARRDDDVFNCYPITIRDRASDYERVTYEWVHAADAAARAAALGGDGVRRADASSLEWVVTGAHAVQISQLRALRSVHVRNQFRVRLGPRWSLLEPGDRVTLSHEMLGLAGHVCRVVEIDQRGTGARSVTLQEVPAGASSPVSLAVQDRDGVTGAGAPTSEKAYVVGAAALDLSNVPSGAISTTNYAEDGSGNPTAGAKLDHTGTALKVAPRNAVLGPTTFEKRLAVMAASNWFEASTPHTVGYSGIAEDAASGLLVAVGGTVTFATSRNGGRTWVTQTGVTNATRDVAAGSPAGSLRFVAVGSSNTCATSPDGVTWTSRTMPAGASRTWTSVIWDGMYYVAVGIDAGAVVTSRSADGVTWGAAVAVFSACLVQPKLAWKSGTIVLVGSTLAGGVLVYTSSDNGTTWTPRTFPSVACDGAVFAAYNQVASIGGVAGNFVVVAQGSNSFSVGSIYSSPDGITWTSRGSASIFVTAMAAGNSVAVMAGRLSSINAYFTAVWDYASYVEAPVEFDLRMDPTDVVWCPGVYGSRGHFVLSGTTSTGYPSVAVSSYFRA